MIRDQPLSVSCSHELACPGPLQLDQHKHLKSPQTWIIMCNPQSQNPINVKNIQNQSSCLPYTLLILIYQSLLSERQHPGPPSCQKCAKPPLYLCISHTYLMRHSKPTHQNPIQSNPHYLSMNLPASM